MGTEVVGTLTHANSLQRGHYATHAGQIHVREQIRMILKTPLQLNALGYIHPKAVYARTKKFLAMHDT
jgi:hypothetical protein